MSSISGISTTITHAPLGDKGPAGKGPLHHLLYNGDNYILIKELEKTDLELVENLPQELCRVHLTFFEDLQDILKNWFPNESIQAKINHILKTVAEAHGITDPNTIKLAMHTLTKWYGNTQITAQEIVNKSLLLLTDPAVHGGTNLYPLTQDITACLTDNPELKEGAIVYLRENIQISDLPLEATLSYMIRNGCYYVLSLFAAASQELSDTEFENLHTALTKNKKDFRLWAYDVEIKPHAYFCLELTFAHLAKHPNDALQYRVINTTIDTNAVELSTSYKNCYLIKKMLGREFAQTQEGYNFFSAFFDLHMVQFFDQTDPAFEKRKDRILRLIQKEHFGKNLVETFQYRRILNKETLTLAEIEEIHDCFHPNSQIGLSRLTCMKEWLSLEEKEQSLYAGFLFEILFSAADPLETDDPSYNSGNNATKGCTIATAMLSHMCAMGDKSDRKQQRQFALYLRTNLQVGKDKTHQETVRNTLYRLAKEALENRNGKTNLDFQDLAALAPLFTKTTFTSTIYLFKSGAIKEIQADPLQKTHFSPLAKQNPLPVLTKKHAAKIKLDDVVTATLEKDLGDAGKGLTTEQLERMCSFDFYPYVGLNYLAKVKRIAESHNRVGMPDTLFDDYVEVLVRYGKGEFTQKWRCENSHGFKNSPKDLQNAWLATVDTPAQLIDPESLVTKGVHTDFIQTRARTHFTNVSELYPQLDAFLKGADAAPSKDKLEQALIEMCKSPCGKTVGIVQMLIDQQAEHSIPPTFLDDIQELSKRIHEQNLPKEELSMRFASSLQDWLLMGAHTGGCQDVFSKGDLPKGLIGYIKGSNTLLALFNNQGKMVGRCVVRLALNAKTQKPAIHIEQLYTHFAALNKDRTRDVLIQYMIAHFEAQNTPVPEIYTGEFERYMEPEKTTDLIAGNDAAYEYVDSGGGMKMRKDCPFTFKGIKWEAKA